MKLVEIFTDGACRGNPGPGGWGVLMRYDTEEALGQRTQRSPGK